MKEKNNANGQFMCHVSFWWNLKAFRFYCNKTDHPGMLV